MPACARIALRRPGPIVSPDVQGDGDAATTLRMLELRVGTSLSSVPQ